MGTTATEILRGLSDVVFPPECVHCRGLVAATAAGGEAGFRHLCVRCARQLTMVVSPHCRTCGHPFFGEMAGDRECVKCQGLEAVYGEGRTAVIFNGPARALVIALKYHRGLYVLADMEEVFRRVPEMLAHVRGATLVPVPLHPRKARERGYNQAWLLAEVLAKVAGGTTGVAELLRRVVDTPTQTAFDRRTRLENLKNAFALKGTAPLNPEVHHVLVDDVFTTGSTLNSCARTLRRAGALKVDVVTFAHG